MLRVHQRLRRQYGLASTWNCWALRRTRRWGRVAALVKKKDETTYLDLALGY